MASSSIHSSRLEHRQQGKDGRFNCVRPVKTMNENAPVIILGLIIFSLFFGALTARSSNRRQRIQSGTIAKAFHYISCSVMAGLTPTVLTSVIILEVPVLAALGTAVIMVGIAVILLMPFAMYEKPAIEEAQRAADTGWTEADARASGL